MLNMNDAPMRPAQTQPSVLVHFVRNGSAYLPELDAYADFIRSHGHQSQVHTTSTSVPDHAQVVWWMCGRVLSSEARRLKSAFHIHEYASASVPPHARLKDWVKHWAQPKPDYRLFQNGWVRERMGFDDGVPHGLRDMGVAPSFFATTAVPIPPKPLTWSTWERCIASTPSCHCCKPFTRQDARYCWWARCPSRCSVSFPPQ